MDNRIKMLRQVFNVLNSKNDISGFGKAIEFYIATGYDEYLTIEEINEELNNFANNQPTKANFDNYFTNVITDGYFTHTFNGYMLEHYIKHGIGAKLTDTQLSENFAILEKFIGASNYVSRYAKEIPEFYITSPGNNSIYYALTQSPERLWHGPLSQKDDLAPILPVVGETKSQFAMRIVEHKIAKLNLSPEEQDIVRKAAEVVIGKLCTTNPMIAFIPIKLLMDCYVMKSGIYYKNLVDISEIDYIRQNGVLLSEYLQGLSYYNADAKQVDSTFFCKNFGGDWDKSELDDISVLGTVIPFDNIQTIELEDSFTVVQRILNQYGFKNGTPFDFDKILLMYYYYGHSREENKEYESSDSLSHCK